MKEMRDLIEFWEARGEPLALATLVAARGSSYRRPGARMLISAAGEFAGGLSAGCIEDEVIACGQQILRSGAPQLLTFDTRLRFGCHGAIDILVEAVREELLAEVRDCLRQRLTFRLETRWPDGTQMARVEPATGAFLQTIEPPLRLLLIGDSSDTLALRAQGTLLGWEVLQLEAGPVPAEWLDDRTAVVLATHNFGRDCAALRALLPAGLKYLGLIGSRRRRDDILFDLLHDQFEVDLCLFAPAGLHLGAETPEEIALSIVSEIQSVFAAASAQHLRERKAAIHQLAEAELASCTASAA